MILRLLYYLHYKITIYFYQRLAIYNLRRQGFFFDPCAVRFRGPCRIKSKGQGIIGDGFICNSGPICSMGNDTMSKISISDNAILKIGKQSGMSNSVISCHEKIIIGDFVNIGDGCLLMDSNFHSTEWYLREDRSKDLANAKTAPIIIGDYVFLGARCIICKGVKIGEHSIIAAGSVVVNDIPADCIAGGNPAHVIKHFDN